MGEIPSPLSCWMEFVSNPISNHRLNFTLIFIPPVWRGLNRTHKFSSRIAGSVKGLSRQRRRKQHQRKNCQDQARPGCAMRLGVAALTARSYSCRPEASDGEGSATCRSGSESCFRRKALHYCEHIDPFRASTSSHPIFGAPRIHPARSGRV